MAKDEFSPQVNAADRRPETMLYWNETRSLHLWSFSHLFPFQTVFQLVVPYLVIIKWDPCFLKLIFSLFIQWKLWFFFLQLLCSFVTCQTHAHSCTHAFSKSVYCIWICSSPKVLASCLSSLWEHYWAERKMEQHISPPSSLTHMHP